MSYNPGLTDTQLRATAVPVSGTITANVSGTVPVSGTFWQATQPISGSVGVTGSVAVTGTFWQATQPVSIAATVGVSGTFWQATQPVSVASMPSTPVTGTFWQETQPVRQPTSTKAVVSLDEQLDQLVAAQVATVHLLSQLLAVCRGVQAPLLGDEADQLIGEFMDNRNPSINIMN